MNLKDSWVPTLVTSIRTCLDAVTKGWFNMAETSYEVYQGSKLKKLMELIKFAMQVTIFIVHAIYIYNGKHVLTRGH